MPSPIIETKDLKFSFNEVDYILNGIDLKVDEGSIYGFLGPNGAGKTTTFRLLLGLLKCRVNCVNLFGKDISLFPKEIYAEIGALIETPSLYEHLTGYENLEITRRIKNVPKKYLAEALEMVRLTGSADQKVSKYSLGMKQRLGLANALISRPRLLILDEPTNGLDPNGILETRELLQSLNRDYSTTILISSHLLQEIEKIVTHVGIINKGSLVFQGTYQDLQELQREQSMLHIRANDNDKAHDLLTRDYKVTKTADNYIAVNYVGDRNTAEICRMRVSAGLDIYDLHEHKQDLKTAFFQLTKN